MARGNGDQPDQPENYSWSCSYCSVGGTAATQADAQSMKNLHEWSCPQNPNN